MTHALRLSALVGALAGWCIGSWGSLAHGEAAPALPPVPQSVIDTANSAPLTRYNRNISGGAHTQAAFNGGWQIPLAVAAWMGNTAADAKLLSQINYNLQGGNVISANGGYPAQHELHVTGMYAILRQSDRFWNEKLTADQRHKIDLVMKAALISSAYTTADATYAPGKTPTALDGDTNMHRGWNPNFREGMFGGLIASTVYFGGAEQARDILQNYNHNAFVTELQNAGLTNIAQTFTWAQAHPGSAAPSAAQIEQHVRNYTYQGKPLADPFDLYAQLTLNTYSKQVTAGLNDGKGIMENGVPTGVIVSGADGLPNRGKVGMLAEFNSVDASGPRSSITYAYDGFRPNLTNHAAVLIGGYWEQGPVADELLQRLDVGITDLVYKLEHGYRNYQHGKGNTTIYDINRADWNISFRTTIPLWTDVLRPYHFAAVPPPASGPVNSSTDWQSFGLPSPISEPVTITFDATPNAAGTDGVIGLLNGPATQWSDLAAIVRFNPDGRIDVRNGGAYDADVNLPYVPGTVYHVRMEIDPANKLYSVFVTPEDGDEILLAGDYLFRSEQALTSVLDRWAVWHGEGSFTVSNFNVSVPEPASAAALLGGSLLLMRKFPRQEHP